MYCCSVLDEHDEYNIRYYTNMPNTTDKTYLYSLFIILRLFLELSNYFHKQNYEAVPTIKQGVSDNFQGISFSNHFDLN